jgi:hypothetical protein
MWTRLSIGCGRLAGRQAFVSRGDSRSVIRLVGDTDQLAQLNLARLRGVADVVRHRRPVRR